MAEIDYAEIEIAVVEFVSADPDCYAEGTR